MDAGTRRILVHRGTPGEEFGFAAFAAAYTAHIPDPAGEACVICLQNYTSERCLEITGVGGCSHRFGENCLRQLFRHSTDGNITCPLCRTVWVTILNNFHQGPEIHEILRHAGLAHVEPRDVVGEEFLRGAEDAEGVGFIDDGRLEYRLLSLQLSGYQLPAIRGIPAFREQLRLDAERWERLNGAPRPVSPDGLPDELDAGEPVVGREGANPAIVAAEPQQAAPGPPTEEQAPTQEEDNTRDTPSFVQPAQDTGQHQLGRNIRRRAGDQRPLARVQRSPREADLQRREVAASDLANVQQQRQGVIHRGYQTVNALLADFEAMVQGQGEEVSDMRRRQRLQRQALADEHDDEARDLARQHQIETENLRARIEDELLDMDGTD